MGLAIVITLVASAPLVAGYVPLPSCGASLRPLAQSALSHVSLSPMSMRHRGLRHAPGHLAARARGQGRKNVGLSCTAGSDDEIEYFDPSGGAGKDEKKSLGRVEEVSFEHGSSTEEDLPTSRPLRASQHLGLSLLEASPNHSCCQICSPSRCTNAAITPLKMRVESSRPRIHPSACHAQEKGTRSADHAM